MENISMRPVSEVKAECEFLKDILGIKKQRAIDIHVLLLEAIAQRLKVDSVRDDSNTFEYLAILNQKYCEYAELVESLETVESQGFLAQEAELANQFEVTYILDDVNLLCNIKQR